jgi:hypothetical protein
MAVELGINKAAVKKRLLRAGRKPFSQEALYTPDDLEAIRNVPGTGRPKKTAAPEPAAKPVSKANKK